MLMVIYVGFQWKYLKDLKAYFGKISYQVEGKGEKDKQFVNMYQDITYLRVIIQTLDSNFIAHTKL